MDNCLSTFKHETMYYPSRIKQLLASSEAHMANISELLLYYKELYAVFLQQAMRQLEPKIGIDTQMLRYLFEQIAKINGLPKLSYRSEANGSYTKIWIDVPDSGLTEEEIKAMFTPSTIDIRYFVCRQLIREFGEENKARGAGIQALRKSDKEITIEIILTTAAWNSLKLLL